MDGNSFNYRDVQQVQNFNTPTTRPQQNRQQSSTSDSQQHGNSFNGRESSNVPEGTPSSDKMRTRKARITLDESDHLLIMRACVANKKDMTSDGKKTAFWEIIRQALLKETGKDLTLPKQVVERAMRDRHFHLEAHPEERGKPSDDEMTRLTDEWMKHMEGIDGSSARWKIQPAPAERRTTSEKLSTPVQETPILPPGAQNQAGSSTRSSAKRNRDQQQQQSTFLVSTKNPQATASGNGKKASQAPEAPMTNSLDSIRQSMDSLFGRANQVQPYSSVYPPPAASAPSVPPPAKRPRLGDEPDAPQRVIVEGGMSKGDWLEVLGQVKAHDPRIPALEQKVDTLIETTKRTHQMLIQLLKNQARRPGGAANLGVNGTELPGVNGEGGVVGD